MRLPGADNLGKDKRSEQDNLKQNNPELREQSKS